MSDEKESIYKELYDSTKKTTALFNMMFEHEPVAEEIKQQIAEACKILIFASSLLYYNSGKRFGE